MWDAENLFSDEQALAAGNSDNIVDTGVNEIGRGQSILLNAVLSGGASGNLVVTVNAADAATSSALTSPQAVATFIVPSDRVARGGSVLVASLPTGCKRFLRLGYAGASGGTITAGLVQGAETSQMKG